jgi:hypothetical protein
MTNLLAKWSNGSHHLQKGEQKIIAFSMYSKIAKNKNCIAFLLKWGNMSKPESSRDVIQGLFHNLFASKVSFAQEVLSLL